MGTPPMNLLQAQVIEHDGKPALRLGGNTIAVLEAQARVLTQWVGA